MKKSSIFALGFAMLAGTAVAQNAQEVTYVEDPSQGYLFNKFSSNWFIQAEGGVAVGFTDNDADRNFGDRFAPAASLYVGKWFSPILGARLGADFMSIKGVGNGLGARPWDTPVGDLYKTKINYFGPGFDVMVNLTNWWCGYKPNRVYNAYFYAGAALYWQVVKGYENNELGWHDAQDRIISMRAGINQEFNITRHFALGLDLRAVAVEGRADKNGKLGYAVEALLSATYKFGKTEWNAPVVPVCPPAENCDEYRARLQAADARIADLEAQLKACLSRPVEKEVVVKAPLATIYYPIGVYRLTSVDRKVLKSVANAMTADTSKKYNVTGWADNYTGSDAVNARLRENRANTVKKQLVKYGVSEDQLNVSTNSGNRVDLGEKCLTLDRAVTIEVAE